MRRGIALAVTLLAMAVAAGGCGYALVGRGSSLPESVQTVHVAAFENRSGRAELDQRLTEATANELVTRGNLRLSSSPSEADAVLTAAIVGYGVNPVTFDAQGRATQYEIVVTADVKLTAKGAETPMWQDNHFTFRQPFDVDVDLLLYRDKEVQAIEELSLKFAQALVTSLREGF